MKAAGEPCCGVEKEALAAQVLQERALFEAVQRHTDPLFPGKCSNLGRK